MKEGEAKIEKYLSQPEQGSSTAGRSARLFGDRAFFNGDWLKRAAGAKGGIYGNDAERSDVSDDRRLSPTASRSTAASTTTRSPSPPDSSRRSTPSGR